MKQLLKFLTCGSVDNGKSTLIGHMLYDAKLLYTDQEKEMELESRIAADDGKLDYSVLLDGLMAEREQGITIDVAYRYFTTTKRSFIVADTPGHEEYTRNMAVGASFADLAVILIDSSQGILDQTRRHARICALMGIEYFVFAVNKIDLIYYKEEIYRNIEKDIFKLAADLELKNFEIIPVSATAGDNMIKKSINTPWYAGIPLLEYLENIDIKDNHIEEGFILPVQRISRVNPTCRGFQGEVAFGNVFKGDKIKVLPSGENIVVEKIWTGDKETDRAAKGKAVTLLIDRELDISRGSVFLKGIDLNVTDKFNAIILWMDEEILVPGCNCLIKLGTKLVPALITEIQYKIDIHTGEHLITDQISKNEIAVCDLFLMEPVVLDRFSKYKSLGRFIVINRISNTTSACGIVNFTMGKSESKLKLQTNVSRDARAFHMNQRPVTLWFTGLSGAGKSALAERIEKKLYFAGKYTMFLDADAVRKGLSMDLEFTKSARIENNRRIAELAKLMNDAGLIVLVAAISPFQAGRDNAKKIIGEENFIEIFISTPLSVCESRDAKGLYSKARKKEISDFTGISSPYEEPLSPDISIDTSIYTLEKCEEIVMRALKKYGIFTE